MPNEFLFMVFCFGFFIYAVNLCTKDNRRAEERQDRRDDLEYYRMLSERREFGYTTNEEHIRPIAKPRFKLF